MRIILLKDIKGLGKKLEVKEVKEGYARNALIPQRLAEIGTPTALAHLATKQAEANAEHAARMVTLREEMTRLQNEIVEFKVKVGEKDEVFGSITSKTIDHALVGKGYVHAKAHLLHPIKSLGSFKVEVDFGEGIKTALTVRAVKEF